MDGSIVISFRLGGALQAPRDREEGTGRTFLVRARALEARARHHGGVLVGWGASRITLAFDGERIVQALSLATELGDDRLATEPAWSVGVAEGELSPFADDGSQAHLAWGLPVVVASALSSAAHAGEILCAQTMRALRSGELLAAGTRVGRDGDLRVRGVRLDPRHPWRLQAVEQLARMRVAPLVGVPPPPAVVASGSLLVLRADPGTGGTRYLNELVARAARSLMIAPSGSGFEPLGALRRAFARSISREPSPLLRALAEPVEALVGGDGVSLEVAARLVAAFLAPRSDDDGAGLLLLDDATNIDPATLEACVAAAREGTFGVVARLDATAGVPSVLAGLGASVEIEIPPLSRDAAELMAGGCTNDALDGAARQRWARLAANVPLGVVESIAYGIVSGDLRWNGAAAAPRSRASGRGKARSAADWMLLRARDERATCRIVLCLIALLGGEAKVTRLGHILEAAGQTVDVDVVLEELIRGRWLVDTQEDWVGLPSRSHRDALATLLEDDARRALHRAAASLLEDEEGAFGRVEAAWHAAQAGDGLPAARVLLAAARATAHARLQASTTQLVAFARRADPSCEASALELLASALARAPSVPPSRGAVPLSELPPASRPLPPGVLTPVSLLTIPDDLAPAAGAVSHDSEPPTIARVGFALLPLGVDVVAPAPSEGPPGDASDVALRLGELAKEALLGADNAALERWVDGLRAAGESSMFTDRLRALSRLGRGEIGDALRVLRRARATLDPDDHKLRCQTSLALGVALSVAGRPQEALLEGMDALARARQVDDVRGATACLAFLAKLFTSVGRSEMGRLRR